MVRLGDLLAEGKQPFRSKVSGQVVEVSSSRVSIWLGRPYLFGPEDSLYVHDGGLVKKGDVIALAPCWKKKSQRRQKIIPGTGYIQT